MQHHFRKIFHTGFLVIYLLSFAAPVQTVFAASNRSSDTSSGFPRKLGVEAEISFSVSQFSESSIIHAIKNPAPASSEDDSRRASEEMSRLGYSLPGYPVYQSPGGLTIEPIAAYNLIVDSNVLSPSSYGPSAASLGAKFCNSTGSTMTNVWAYIGNYDSNQDGTLGDTDPGIYPVRNQTTDSNFNTEHPHLNGTVTAVDFGDPGRFFALEHEAGSITDRTDASRYLGTLTAGECRTEYWLVSYPRVAIVDGSPTDVTGGIKPDDDLWLTYFFWGNADSVATSYYWRPITMRNEISAMANKIWPNGDNKVPDEYVSAIQKVLGWDTWTPNGSGTTAYPGETVTSQGIWYDLGNVGHGFDNDGDLVPDRNIWVQPIGDAGSYDPGCFRLVKTYGLIIVKLNDGSDLLIPFVDRMYFDYIPENNTGAVGLVFYDYTALDGACTAGLTPYQEVASGYDNEKFNGDFGAGIPPLQSQEADMTLEKSGDGTVVSGGTINYTMTFTLPDPDPAPSSSMTITIGNPSVGMPLVFQETIPSGTTYVGGTAAFDNAFNEPDITGAILYSHDGGVTFSATETPANTVTHIQWWLDDAVTSLIDADLQVRVNFSVSVPGSYTAPTVVDEGCLKLGNADCFEEDDHTTLVLGSATIQGSVFADTNTLGNAIYETSTETGIQNVTVSLYYDANGDGDYDDAGDFLVKTVDSTSTAGDYSFTQLPATSGAAEYIVVVDTTDPDITTGYGLTTPPQYTGITLAAGETYGDGADEPSDFGFAPALSLDKRLDTTSTIVVGDTIQYTIAVSNILPGSGGPGSACVYNSWATSEGSQSSTGSNNVRFYNYPGQSPPNPSNSFNSIEPDSLYSFGDFSASGAQTLAGTGFVLGNQGGNITSVKIRVKYYLSATLSNDQGQMYYYSGGNSYATTIFTTATMNTYMGSSNPGWLEVDLGATNPATGSAWQWGDFASGNDIQVVYQNDKINAGDPSLIYIDAIGMEITTDGTCGGGSKVLNPVPLTDTFDDAYFDFISVDPPVSSSGTGTLTWNNIGPLYPGQTRFITVNMRAAQAGATTATDNTATSAGTLFSNGLPANSPESDTATVTIGANANTRTFAGTVFDDNSSPVNGWSGAVWTRTGSETGMDVMDTGIRGVKVNLYGCFDASTDALVTGVSNNPCSTAASGNDGEWRLVRTTFTDANGNYLFQNLGQGHYYAKVDTSYIIGSQVADVNQAGVCTVCDSLSNIPATDNLNAAFVGNLSGNTSVARVNFGYNVTGSYNIGDLLFYDWDGDGVQDAEDEGLSGATVRLLDPNGAEITTTTTAQDGSYLFSGYPNGIYTVQVDASTLPSGLVQSLDPEDVFDNLSRFTLNGVDDLNRDFAYQPTGSGTIGDTVWRDMNGDGTQSGTQETGISGVTVQLQVDLNGDGTYVTIATDTTDSKGQYLFENLPVGASYNYRVALELSGANLTAIPNDAYGNDYYNTTGSLDITPTSDIIYRTATITSGSPNDLSADFGFAPPASMGDTIFWDTNGNGTQDAGEAGIPDAKVDLYTFTDSNSNYRYDPGETVAYFGTDYTDADGKYLFSGLVPDYYVVIVDTTTASYDPGSGLVANPILNPTLTSDPSADGVPQSCSIDTSNLLCDARDGMRLYANTNYMGADFGFQPNGSFGDFIWLDQNGDGVQDSGEPGLAGVTVSIDDGAGTVLTTTTNSDGYYFFQNLNPITTWTVSVTNGLPAGVSSTYDSDTGTTGPDGVTTVSIDASGVVINIGAGACTDCNLDVDFGHRYPAGTATLSGTICRENFSADGWCGEDPADENGVDNTANPPAETAYNNIAVYLYLWDDAGGDGDGNVDSDELTQVASTSTANADYSFGNLAAGTYVVSIAAPEDNLDLNTTAAIVGSPTTLLVSQTAADGDVTSAYQVVTVADGATITNRDFALEYNQNYDFGDLPGSYASSQSGRHVIPGAGTSLYLGNTLPDSESGSLPSTNADGDDTDTADDEDGVALTGTWGDGVFVDDGSGNANGAGGSVSVTTNGANGWLVGWIDFNSDGDFSDTGEMIVSQAVSAGTNIYSFNIPAGTFGQDSDTALYSRFRLFTAKPLFPSIAYTGEAEAGEVEDYRFAWTITVDKDTNTPEVAPGGQAEYAIVVTNTGNQMLTGVQISDNLDNIRNANDFTFASMSTPVENNATRTASLNPAVGATNLTWGTWDINPGGSVTLVFQVNVSALIPADAATSYDNTAMVSSDQLGTVNDDGTVANDSNTPTSPMTDPEEDEDIVVVLKPDLTVTKINDATDSIVAAGSTFNWTITTTDSTVAASFADAEVILRDTLPGLSTYYPQGSLTVDNGTPAPTGTIDCSISGVTLECVANGAVDMAATASFGVTFAVTPTVVGTLANTATVDPDGTIAEVNESNNQAIDTVSVFDMRPSKSIVATSESFTTLDGTERVSIGEMVRYRISALIQEGSFTNVQLVDNIPNGLQFLDDGTARFTLVSNGGGITSSTLACANDSGNAIDTTSLPSASVDCLLAGAISDSADADALFGSGENVTFSLGDLTNSDSDADNEYIVVEFNALVLNVNSTTTPTVNQGTDNQDASNVTNYRLNNASLLINGSTVGLASPNVTVSVAEPAIVTIDKSVSPVATAYLPGDTLTYTLTFINDTMGQTNAATAFDIQVTDTFDSNLTVGTVTVDNTDQGATCIGGTASTTSNSTVGQDVTVNVTCLDPGKQVVVTIEATINAGVASGTDITNDANLVYTSLPGLQGNCSAAPFSCAGVGTTGTGTGERNGSGGTGADSTVLNNYVASSSTVTSPVLYGSITIVKDAVPNHAQDFDFSGDATFSLDDDSDATLSNTQTYSNVVPGTYTITEAAVTGWSLTGLSCTGDADNGSTLTLATRTAEIDLDAGEDITCTFTNTQGAPSLNVTKVADVASVSPASDQIVYTYTIENTGNVDLTNITLVDDNYTSGNTGDDFNPVYQSGDTSNTDVLDVGETWTYEYTVTVSQAQIDAGTDLVNVATADSDETGPDTATETVTISATAVISNYVWDDANGDGAQVGEIGLDGVRVYIDEDGDNTYDVGEPTDVTAGGGLYSITGLAAGSYDVCIDTATLPADYAQTYDLDGTGTAHEASVTVTAGQTRTDVDFGYQLQTAALTIEKSTNGQDADTGTGPTVEIGDTITWTYVVTNTGSVTLTNITVTDDQIANDAADIDCGGGDNTISTLDPGAGNPVTCTAKGTATAGQYSNVGTASTTYSGNPVTATDPSHYYGESGTISGQIRDDLDNDGTTGGIADADDTGLANATVTLYTDPNGDGDPTDGVQIGSAVTTPGTGNYSFTNLVSGTYVIVEIDPTNYTSVMDADGDTSEPDYNLISANLCIGCTSTGNDFLDVTADPQIVVDKSLRTVTFDSPQFLRLTYDIEIQNTGNTILNNVQITDDLATTFALADSISVVSVLPGPFTLNPTYDGDTDGGTNPTHINLLAGTDSLAPSDSGTLTIVVLIDTGGKAQNYRNTAVAEGAPPFGDPVTDDDFADGPSFIDPAVTKAVSPDQAAVGDQVTYTITVFNNGTQPAADVIVTDTFPNNLDLVPGSVTVNPPVNATNPPDYITITAPRTFEVRLGTLDVNDVYVITVQALVNSLGQPPIQNSVGISTTSPTPWDGNLSSNDQAVASLNMTDDPRVRSLPDTGFAPNKVTVLPQQPAELAYADLGEVWLEIPRLGVKTSIVGVPRSAGAWDVDWLWEQAGWLQGTAFPTWEGNSVVTGHVYLPSGKPGPFVDLPKLRWGDQLIIHAFGQRHVYEVRMNRVDMPDNLSALKHEDQAWLTLITCRGYDESSDVYKYRIVTRAVLIRIEAER